MRLQVVWLGMVVLAAGCAVATGDIGSNGGQDRIVAPGTGLLECDGTVGPLLPVVIEGRPEPRPAPNDPERTQRAPRVAEQRPKPISVTFPVAPSNAPIELRIWASCVCISSSCSLKPSRPEYYSLLCCLYVGLEPTPSYFAVFLSWNKARAERSENTTR